MAAESPAPSPSPPSSPTLDFLTNGHTASELWALLWPGLAGVTLLALGAATVVGYLRRWFTSDWPPHWSPGAFGLLLAATSAPAFLAFAERVESGAAEAGLPVLTFLMVVAAQLGLLDEDGSRRRRRR